MHSSRGHGDAVKLTLALVAFVFAIFTLIVRWLYFALMESSSWQATLGKKALGLRVTGMDGQRIGFGRATGRYFGKILSAMTFILGYIMAGFMMAGPPRHDRPHARKKQALHDMIAGPLVVRNSIAARLVFEPKMRLTTRCL